MENHGHIWYVCEKEECHPCMFCEGGLGHCTACDGFEGTLTTHCSGVKVSKADQELCYKQGLDYTREKGWYRSELDIHGRKIERTIAQIQTVDQAVARLRLASV